ncbi:MAG: hypothetical protein JW719_01145 [Pirellulales bacterium]|nr:hypothetical protein [Pirellulales bacterium]
MTPSFTITEEFIERGLSRENYSDYTATESYPVYSRLEPPGWLPDIFKQLEAIASLPDGWDSYGAPAPDVNKLEAAGGLLFCLCVNSDLPKPYVNPTRNGGVQFEWEKDQRYFEIEVVGERAATYLYNDEVARVEETGDLFEAEDLEPLQAFIRKVVASE